MSSSLTLTALDGIPTIAKGDDLAAIILQAASAQGLAFQNNDVLVLAQKVVSKSEGRRINLKSVMPSARAQELAEQTLKDPRIVELILRESKSVVRSQPHLLIVEHRLGFILANAGIDASNVEDEMEADDSVLLLPEQPDQSALALRTTLKSRTGMDIGIVINDSFGRPWRLGTTGTAIGVAGIPGLVDMRGQKDRKGREMQVTEVGVADELSAAASLLMGQAAEGRPVIHVRGFPYPMRDGKATELIRPQNMDQFR